MKIALFGKRFEAAYDDAVKHVLRRVLALDASPIVNGAFREELLERMDVAEQLGEYTSPEEVAACDLMVVIGGMARCWRRRLGCAIQGCRFWG